MGQSIHQSSAVLITRPTKLAPKGFLPSILDGIPEARCRVTGGIRNQLHDERVVEIAESLRDTYAVLRRIRA